MNALLTFKFCLIFLTGDSLGGALMGGLVMGLLLTIFLYGINKGKEKVTNKQYASTINKAERTAFNNPNDSEALFVLAMKNFNTGYSELAFPLYQKCYSQDFNKIECLMFMGIEYAGRGDYDNVIKMVEEFNIKIDTNKRGLNRIFGTYKNVLAGFMYAGGYAHFQKGNSQAAKNLKATAFNLDSTLSKQNLY